MRPRRLLPVVLGLVATLAFPAPAGAEGAPGVSIRRVDGSAFPNVSVVVALQNSGDGAPADLRLWENDSLVRRITVTRLASSGTQVDVVLAVDESDSMIGAPLQAALDAARSFVRNLPPGIRVGVVTFASRPRVAAALTSTHAAATTALQEAGAESGTSLYDAVVTASGLFSGPAQRNLVLLSDGRDTSSDAGLRDAVAAAKRAQVAVFSVGLGTGVDSAALQQLSVQTGGRFAPVDQADLGAIYGGLATELSHQFLVVYRSSRAAGSQVSLRVETGGASDTALILLRAKAPAVPPPPPRPGAPFLSGVWGEGVVLTLGFLAIFLILWMMLGTRARANRDRDLARLMAAKAEASPERSDREGLTAWLPDSMVEAGQRVAQAGGFSITLDGRLERAGWPVKAGEFVAGTAAAALLGAFIGTALLGNWVFGLLLALSAGAAPSVALGLAKSRRGEKMHGQLADIFMTLASSLRAGHSFLQSLDMVAREIAEPASTEFARVVAEIRLGRPVDEALDAMAERIGSEDLTWAVLAVNIQREVGGNLAEILDTLADVVRERNTIRRQVGVLSAEGRMSMWILAILPCLIALYMSWANPAYIKLLITTQVGLVMLSVAVSLMILGVFWMRKLVKIRV